MGSLRTALIVVLLVLAAMGCGQQSSVDPLAPGETSAALAEITSAPAPSGMEPLLWQKLTAELARVLGARASLPVIPQRSPAGTRALLKSASTPPFGEGSATTLNYVVSTSVLSWEYYNQGDYDQNGEVNIADLTPIALHFGETGPFPSYSLLSVIDGDVNGEINLADVTPIGLNFRNRVGGYRLYQAADLGGYPAAPDQPNGAGAKLISTFSLPSAAGATGRLSMLTQVVPTPYTQWYWVRPFDSAQDGTPSNNVSVIAPENLAPTAKIGNVPATPTLAHIVWSGSASKDTDGTVVRYEWDFDGDGVFEYDGGATATADYYYYAPGVYQAALRVTDNDFATNETQGSVEVTAGATWHETTVFAENYQNSQPVSLMQVEGNPAVMCMANLSTVDPSPIMWCRAQDAYGDTWTEPKPIVQPAAGQATFGIGAVISNRPVCVYTGNSDPSNNVLYYLRANDSLGGSWGAPKLIGQPPDPGSMVPRQLIVVDGKPAVVGGFNSTFYVAAQNVNGTAWDEFISLPFGNHDAPIANDAVSAVSVAGLASLIRPINGEDLLYSRAAQPDGASWSENVLVDSLETVAGGAKLIEVSGLPAVFYYDEVMGALKYRRARNVDGSEWEPPLVLDSRAEGFVLPFVVDSRPCIMYSDRISNTLNFMAANDASGSYWGSPAVVYETWDNYRNPTIAGAEIAGQPAFAYRQWRETGDPPEQPVEQIAYAMYR